MSDTIQTKGSCLCGAVSFQAKAAKTQVGACHCSMCRKWSSGPLLAVDCGTEVSFSGEEHIGRYDSSMWAERGFCQKCGTNLFYRIKQSGQYIVSAGVLEDDSKLVFDHQIFIDEKPQYYCFANDTQNMTGAEVFAQFMPPQD